MITMILYKIQLLRDFLFLQIIKLVFIVVKQDNYLWNWINNNQL